MVNNMAKDMSFESVMARNGEIMKDAIGIDYNIFESGSIAFDYERMMRELIKFQKLKLG